MTPKDKLGLDWSAVEKSLAEGTPSGYKMGIIETEKIFKQLLQERKIPGRQIERQIKYMRQFLSMPDKLERSRKIHQEILQETAKEISREETKQVISGYWQAMIDIEEVIRYLSLGEKLKFRIKHKLSQLTKKIKKILAWLLIFLGIVLLLSDTTIGQNIWFLLIVIARWLILKILPWVVAILIIFYFIRNIARFFKKTKKSI